MPYGDGYDVVIKSVIFANWRGDVCHGRSSITWKAGRTRR
jgi:hypothetical protein